MNRALSVSLLLALVPVQAQAQVYADFVLRQASTEIGRFTALLDHQYSPHAVANFIRLAEGLVPWTNADGEVETGPFYDGLDFHETTSGWEVVTGSPSGEGEDGPGWTIRDDGRSAGTQYSLFMENQGPNTNGSRFFINLTAAMNPNRQDGEYSRFGQAIAPTNPPGGNGLITLVAVSNFPGGHITIDSVTLRYVGANAQLFRSRVVDPNDPVLFSLPSAREAVFSFRHEGGSILLDWDDTPGSGVNLWGSVDLRTWTDRPFTVFNVPGSTEFGFDLSSTIAFQATGFFRGGVVEYPHWPSTDRPLAGGTIQTHFIDPSVGQVIITYSFDGAGSAGAYSSNVANGTFTVTDQTTLDPHTTAITLTPDSGNLPAYRLILHYDLDWTTPFPNTALPVTANPSRLDGENVGNPGSPLVSGRWSYFPAP